jgi:nucleoside phosphorylase
MSHSPDCPSRADYTVGWICALPAEYTAAQVFLDIKYPQPDSTGNGPGDDNHYTHGSVAGHNVVIAVLPGGDYGTASAANVATNLSRSYPNVRIGLFVGIGGGAPTSERDIRLGDVVVGEPGNAKSGVFQYDFGKVVQEGDYEYTKVLNKPPVVLRTALTGLKSRYEINGHSLGQAVEDILTKNRRLRKTYGKPSSDILFKSHVLHSRSCQEADCSREEENLVEREARDEEDNILVHYGLIATGNSVMKDATLRDEFAERERVLCFEMEAGGLMDTLPCLVIRGICDYSDSHKNKQWQGYATLVAAAFAKDLLGEVRPSAVQSERQLSEVLKTSMVSLPQRYIDCTKRW